MLSQTGQRALLLQTSMKRTRRQKRALLLNIHMMRGLRALLLKPKRRRLRMRLRLRISTREGAPPSRALPPNMRNRVRGARRGHDGFIGEIWKGRGGGEGGWRGGQAAGACAVGRRLEVKLKSASAGICTPCFCVMLEYLRRLAPLRAPPLPNSTTCEGCRLRRAHRCCGRCCCCCCWLAGWLAGCIRCWLLAAGCWLLAAGCWLLLLLLLLLLPLLLFYPHTSETVHVA